VQNSAIGSARAEVSTIGSYKFAGYSNTNSDPQKYKWASFLKSIGLLKRGTLYCCAEKSTEKHACHA
jgi:hypothetical protein